ncbi:hypothetical protein W97_01693 [Coniosporium apollinis CBS 100218]|uniref:Hypervirulence associated protein TUDOR domain-containing protein n=1 Tax=Coniosporium apollinis (strain CBS 100218) TaxID=1168221 RepID=R7YLF8_CONA1|nr:uncharacterized protein W97_01693 [Coniosporium apollinis CBS 100218]EON62471.1 hypothetical protein W97_01693 [Coniosporium apollinis CBS 100218]
MGDKFQEGDRVSYKPVGGKYYTDAASSCPDSNTSISTGIILSVLKQDTEMDGRTMHANPNHVRYEIENVNTGKAAAVFEENIIEVVGDDEVVKGRP